MSDDTNKKPRDLASVFRRVWSTPWTIDFLKRDRELGRITLTVNPFTEFVQLCNGHFIADYCYIEACQVGLDKKIHDIYLDGEFPALVHGDEASVDWEGTKKGVAQYYTEGLARAVPIIDTKLLVHTTDDPHDISPTAVLCYKMGTSTGLDIPKFVALDIRYHYQFRKHAHHLLFDRELNTVMYFEHETDKYPAAMVASMSPEFGREVQEIMDASTFFPPSDGKKEGDSSGSL